MKHTKIFIYSSIGIVFLFILSVWISTQWVAAILHYHHQLGKPLFVFYGYPIYTPKLFYWWYFYGVYAPKAFDRAAIAIYAGVFIFISFAVAAAIWRSRRPKVLSSHGTARWADNDDIKSVGLLDNQSVILGKNKEGYLFAARWPGTHHVDGPDPCRKRSVHGNPDSLDLAAQCFGYRYKKRKLRHNFWIQTK